MIEHRHFFYTLSHSVVVVTATLLVGGIIAGCGGGSAPAPPIPGPSTPVTPMITWAPPAAIAYGTALSSAQLNASSQTPGSFVYSPAVGTVLGAGGQTLSVTFNPVDTVTYQSVKISVPLTVTKAVPTITWPVPASVSAGGLITASELNATSPVAGSFVYSPPLGTTELVPGNLTLTTILNPADTMDYLPAVATNTLPLTTPGPPTYPAYSWQNAAIVAGGYVDGLYFHPAQKGLMYMRTDIGGAYRWDQAQGHWTPLLDWANRSQGAYWGTGALAIDPTDPKWLYLGVGYSGKNGNLLVSSDQGKTFTVVALPFQIGSNDNGRNAGERLAVDPNLPSRLYFGTKLNGLYYSDDHGLSWMQNATFPKLDTTNQQGVVFVLPVKSSGAAGNLSPVIFAGVAEPVAGGTLNTLYLSTDAGATWNPVTGQLSGTLLPTRGVLGPANELYVAYDDALGPNSMTQGMISSYTFTSAGVVSAIKNISPSLPNGVTAGFGDVTVDPSAAGVLMAATMDISTKQDYIYRSTNDGSTWINLANATHDTTGAPWLLYHGTSTGNGTWINSLVIDPFDANHAIYGTGGVVFTTSNLLQSNNGAPVAWTVGAQGLEETFVRAIASPPSGPTLLLDGVDDLTGFAHSDLKVSPTSQMFINPRSQNVTGIDFSEANPQFVVRVGGLKTPGPSSPPYGAYSNDAGVTWTPFTGASGTAGGDGTIALSADGATMVWAPYDTATVYSNDNGTTWTSSSGAPKQQKVVSDRINPNKFYAANGNLYESTDKGRTFTIVATGMSYGYAYASFAAEGDVWVASFTGGLWHNTGTPSNIVMTRDTRFQSAYQLAFGAPKPGSGFADTVYVYGNMAGIDGVYRSTDNGATWVQIDDQQHQFADIYCLAADRRTFGTLYIGTRGRGVVYGTSTY